MTKPADILLQLRNIQKSFGSRTVLDHVDLDIFNGEFLTLLGPSGCGKTTILRLIAGFEYPDGGEILLNGRPLSHVPPEQRPINTVFQNYALFPHMSVFDNVAFGLKMKRLSKDEIHRRVMEVLTMVRLQDYATRRPNQLSGGQQQRVALARAAVNEPALLLLDESLSALDFKLRKQMQMELKALQRRLGITFVFVTHDQEEALSMSDRVVVMREGHIEQIGTPRQIYEQPRTLYVANFVGDSNILEGRIIRRQDERYVDAEVEGLPCTLLVKQPLPDGSPIKVLLRPEDLRVYELHEPHQLEFWFDGQVIERNYKGMTLESVIRLPNGKQIIASEFFDENDPDFDYTPGEKVRVGWVRNWERVMTDD